MMLKLNAEKFLMKILKNFISIAKGLLEYETLTGR